MDKTYLQFDCRKKDALPEQFAGNDVRFTEELSEFFINRYTTIGGIVFDPFAGYGTTLFAAEKTGRTGIGIELVAERAEYIAQKLTNMQNIICGDSLKLLEYSIPKIDFSFTSPPYMTKNGHPEYPFAGYRVTGAGYDDYLRDIQKIYSDMRRLLKPDAKVMIEVSNIKKNGVLTPLAWDIAEALSAVLSFQKEFIICWTNSGASDGGHTYGFGYDHSYCLLFDNK